MNQGTIPYWSSARIAASDLSKERCKRHDTIQNGSKRFEPATEAQMTYISQLQKRCEELGTKPGTDSKAAESKARASHLIYVLKDRVYKAEHGIFVK